MILAENNFVNSHHVFVVGAQKYANDQYSPFKIWISGLIFLPKYNFFHSWQLIYPSCSVYTQNFNFQALCEEFEQECSASLAQSIQRHLSEADQAKASGNENWWKAHEAAMLALGSVHEVIEGQIEEGKVDFDIKGFLENVVLNDAANPGMCMIFFTFK